MWESEDLIDKKIDWNKPPKEKDCAWHIKIEMIDLDGEKFERIFQSTLTTRKWVSDEEPEEAPPFPDNVPGPEHPPSPDYMPGHEHLPSSDYVSSPEEPEQAPLSPDYVPEPEYPEYLAPSDAEAPIEDQPLLDDASPTALSPGYVADSDPEEDPEEDPADGGDDVDYESSDDDDDDDEKEQEAFEDDDEEEEHPALTDSFAVPIDDPVPSADDTEAF
ncbi:hypothetical protein Tco_0611813 [Tanacetum coccineum]